MVVTIRRIYKAEVLDGTKYLGAVRVGMVSWQCFGVANVNEELAVELDDMMWGRVAEAPWHSIKQACTFGYSLGDLWLP